MKKPLYLIPTTTLLISFGLLLASCGGDDEEPAKAQISFTETSFTTKEGGDVVEIEVKLDKPAKENIVVNYELSGTAIEKSNPDPREDYEIPEHLGEVKIRAGETAGKIKVIPYVDWEVEDDNFDTDHLDPETVIITLTDVLGEGTIQSDKKQATVNIEQEDGRVVTVSWEYDPVVAKDTVDMDLIAWIDFPDDDDDSFNGLHRSITRDYAGYEAVFIPYNVDFFENATFGISYNYYKGNVEPMEFHSEIIDIIDGEWEPELNREKFTAIYTKANINPWDISNAGFYIQQTFTRVNGVYSLASEIAIPESGSRLASLSWVPSNLLKLNNKIMDRRIMKAFGFK